MKKLIFISILVFSTASFAQGHKHHKGYWARHHGGGGWTWMVPTIIGGAIVYEAARRQPVYIQQQPVIVEQQPNSSGLNNQTCSPWTETQNPDGTITRTRTCNQ